ncbi:DUF1722 domain-containing protein [Anaerobacillus alkaliphilus]|uniref:DUF1722 domain-containing protein n=1 Tax=Anaerobacillus alkaliphilus TaxID=1548597 RepID=A0A4V1LGV6_9BACI|nr:DUF523 and DUF1722 domain-containing protein [Anaerobacillus alkaliphilus]RXJ04065.1 DUF1722 domain-containing protein [Anaerobacillus alkaliphilus]
MREFVKPKVVVSKCLEFQECRYDGEIIRDQTVHNLLPFVDFIPVCPEVEIGLGVPRDVIRIIDNNGEDALYQPAKKQDLTEKMVRFSEQFLAEVGEIDGFILKNRSPSCGMNDVKVYAKAEKSPIVRSSSGLFGKQVQERFGYLAVEDEGRLKNWTIREHFFTKLFTIAAFKKLKKQGLIADLVEYHASNKYLFMAYQPTTLKKMGHIVGNHERKSLQEIFEEYEKELYNLFQKLPKYTSNISVSQHLFGFFSKELSSKEKEFFITMIDKYKKKKVPLSSVVSLLKSWALRFDNDYLLKQTYFDPYPERLVEISDSGKGRDYR